MLAKTTTTSLFSHVVFFKAHTLLTCVTWWISACMWLWLSHWSQWHIQDRIHQCWCFLIIHRRTWRDTNMLLLCSATIIVIYSPNSAENIIYSCVVNWITCCELSSCVCYSDNILQSYQPAVQHHLRVLHWGHLSSHDGMQHVSYLHSFWFIHRSPAEAHWFIYQKSSVLLVNSLRYTSLGQHCTTQNPEFCQFWSFNCRAVYL